MPGKHTSLVAKLRDLRASRRTKQKSNSYQRYRTAVNVAKLNAEEMKEGQGGTTYGAGMF
jgi:hypothetical protein